MLRDEIQLAPIENYVSFLEETQAITELNSVIQCEIYADLLRTNGNFPLDRVLKSVLWFCLLVASMIKL